MRWYFAEDIIYYEVCKSLNKKLLKDYSSEEQQSFYESWHKYFSAYDDVIMMPSIDEVKDSIGKKNIVFISSFLPPEDYKNIFIVKELDNFHGALTTQEVANSVSLSESLENKLGLKSSQPSLTFNDLGGSYGFKKWSKMVELSLSKGNPIKPVFLLGVPGVGKSYLASCYAGEKGIPLMQLDLSIVKEKRDPANTLRKVFQYISKMEQEVVLLIDEIEQSVTVKSTELLGSLLTIFNDLNTPAGYQLNGVLFATSNNISKLVESSPQFIRHGRWNEKFFVNYPSKEESLDVMLFYRDRYKLNKTIFNDDFIELMYIISAEEYKDSNINERTSVYSNSEISYLFERLSLYYSDNMDIDKVKVLVEEQIKAVEPLQKTAHSAIQRLLNDAKNNKFTEV